MLHTCSPTEPPSVSPHCTPRYVSALHAQPPVITLSHWPFFWHRRSRVCVASPTQATCAVSPAAVAGHTVSNSVSPAHVQLLLMYSLHSPSALHTREIAPPSAPLKQPIVCVSPHCVAGHTMPSLRASRHMHSPTGVSTCSRTKYRQWLPGRPPQLSTRRVSLA